MTRKLSACGSVSTAIPEPALTPPEYPEPPLRCCLCGRPVPEALELTYGVICRRCLTERLLNNPLDDAAALLCATVLKEPEHRTIPVERSIP